MKNKAVKSLLIALSLVTAMSVTACGKSGEAGDDTQDTSEWYDVSRENMDEEESSDSTAETTTTTADSSSEPEETESSSSESSDSSKPDDSSSSGGSSGGNSSPSGGNGNPKNFEEKELPKEIYTPDIEIYGDKNIGDTIALYNVKVNGKIMDIRSETVDTFVSKAGIKRDANSAYENPFEEKEEEYDGIFWFGGGYGVYTNAQDASKRFTGTHVFIEGAENGFVAAEVDAGIEGRYSIRSVYSNINTEKNDFEVIFAGGIKCGMTRSEVEKIIGSKGNDSKGYVFYANKENALLIHYNKDDVAEEIYLYNDFDDMPILYVGAEADSSDSSEEDTSRPDEEKDGEREQEKIPDESDVETPNTSPESPKNPDVQEVKTQ